MKKKPKRLNNSSCNNQPMHLKVKNNKHLPPMSMIQHKLLMHLLRTTLMQLQLPMRKLLMKVTPLLNQHKKLQRMMRMATTNNLLLPPNANHSLASFSVPTRRNLLNQNTRKSNKKLQPVMINNKTIMLLLLLLKKQLLHQMNVMKRINKRKLKKPSLHHHLLLVVV